MPQVLSSLYYESLRNEEGYAGEERYLVQLWDDDLDAPNLGTADIRDNAGVIMSRETEAKTWPSHIIPTQAEVTLLVQGEDAFDYFSTLGFKTEGSVHLIFRYLSGGLIFRGIVKCDLIQIEDVCDDAHFAVTITATDGLETLKNVDYAAVFTSGIYSQYEDIYHDKFNLTDYALFGLGAFTGGETTDVTGAAVPNGGRSWRGTWIDAIFNQGNDSSRWSGIAGAFVGGPDGDLVNIDLTLNVFMEHNDYFIQNSARIELKLWRYHDPTDTWHLVGSHGRTNGKQFYLYVHEADLLLDSNNHFLPEIIAYGDLIRLEINAESRIKLHAKTSLYRLENKYATVGTHVRQILNQINISHLFGTDVFLRMMSTWTWPTVPGSYYWGYFWVSYNAFITSFKDGNLQVMSAYDALMELAKAFGFIVTYRDGAYVCYQIEALKEAEWSGQGLEIDGTVEENLSVESSWRFDPSHSTTTNKDRLTGGYFTYIPPAQNLSLRYRRWNSANFLEGADGNGVFTGTWVKSSDHFRIKLRFRIHSFGNPPPGPINNDVHDFVMSLQIGDTFLFANQSWAPGYDPLRHGEFLPGIAEWTATPPADTHVLFPHNPTADVADLPAEYEIEISVFNPDGTINEDIYLPQSPPSGPLTFSIVYDKTFGGLEGGLSVDLDPEIEWIEISLVNAGANENDNIYEETIVQEISLQGVTNENREINLLFHDRAVLDNDPGRIMAGASEGSLVDIDLVAGPATVGTYSEYIRSLYASLNQQAFLSYQGSMIAGDYMQVLSKGMIWHPQQMGWASNRRELSGYFVFPEYTYIEPLFTERLDRGDSIGAPTTSPNPQGGGGGQQTALWISGSQPGDGTMDYAIDNFDLALTDMWDEEEINARIDIRIQGISVNYDDTYSITIIPPRIVFTRPIANWELITWRIRL